MFLEIRNVGAQPTPVFPSEEVVLTRKAGGGSKYRSNTCTAITPGESLASHGSVGVRFISSVTLVSCASWEGGSH